MRSPGTPSPALGPARQPLPTRARLLPRSQACASSPPTRALPLCWPPLPPPRPPRRSPHHLPDCHFPAVASFTHSPATRLQRRLHGRCLPGLPLHVPHMEHTDTHLHLWVPCPSPWAARNGAFSGASCCHSGCANGTCRSGGRGVGRVAGGWIQSERALRTRSGPIQTSRATHTKWQSEVLPSAALRGLGCQDWKGGSNLQLA